MYTKITKINLIRKLFKRKKILLTKKEKIKNKGKIRLLIDFMMKNKLKILGDTIMNRSIFIVRSRTIRRIRSMRKTKK